MKVSLDSKKMFLPLKKVKGTAQQRMQKARNLNLAFYEALLPQFVDRKITPAKFKTTISKTAGKAFNIGIENSLTSALPAFSYTLSGKGKKGAAIDGYLFSIPKTGMFEETISKGSAANFLKVTQRLFNEITNPKFLKRALSIDAKSRGCSKQLAFYEENITGKNSLQEKLLDKLLKSTPEKIKIDVLQLFRYKLMSEHNIRLIKPQLDKMTAKADNITFVNKNYDLSGYKFEEKMNLLNRKLAELLSIERAKK